MASEPDTQNCSEKNVEKMRSSMDTKKAIKAFSSKIFSRTKIMPENICSRLMLQDTTIQNAPIQLDKLFSHFKIEKMTKSEILFQLVYLVALESGFAERYAYSKYESELHFSYVIPSFFNWHNVYSLVHQKPKFTCDKNGTTFSMQLRNIVSDRILENAGVNVDAVYTNMSAIVTGDLMIVSIAPVQFEDASLTETERSICLNIPRFLVGPVSQKGKKLCECLRNMEEFVFQLRNEMFIPLRNYQFSLLELDSFPSLLGLPVEAYEIIFRYLSKNQLDSLANVNKLLNHIIVSSKDYEKKLTESIKPLPVRRVRSTTSTIFEDTIREVISHVLGFDDSLLNIF